MVIARDGKLLLVGRDWLAQLNFKVREASQGSEDNKIENGSANEAEMSSEQKLIKQKFPKNFSRYRKIVGHTKKVDFKEHAKIILQKGRRVSLQMQQAEEEEIKNVLKSGHISRVEKTTEDMFI